MFTGIISATGRIKNKVAQNGDDYLFQITADRDFLAGVSMGSSVAVNGVCLTVNALTDENFNVYVSAETAMCTTIDQLEIDTLVNLESAACFGDPLDGHLVSGHIDGIGQIAGREIVGDSVCFEIKPPVTLMPLIAVKGSICVDGVSLTVNTVKPASFSVNIIPYTLQNTGFQHLQPGAAVNIEADLIARYVANVLSTERR